MLGFMEDPFYPNDLKMRLLGRISIEKPELFKQLTEQEEIYRKLVEEATRANQQP